MSQYKVINTFKDLQHGGLVYKVGDSYPAEGQELVESRVEELTKIHPNYGIAFIEVVEVEEAEKIPETPKKSTKSTSKTAKNTEKSDE